MTLTLRTKSASAEGECQKINRLLRKLALLEKIALFEQIVLKILRAYACIRSKNFTKKMPKMAVLASQ